MGTKPVPMAPNFYVDITGLKSQASSSKLDKLQAVGYNRTRKRR